MLRVVAVAALATLVLSVSAEGASAPPNVKKTEGTIAALGMDGAVVAYDDVSRDDCHRLFAWNVRTGATVRVSGRDTCYAQAVVAVAVAGPRIAWLMHDGGNTHGSEQLYAATLPKPKENLKAEADRLFDEGPGMSGLVGGGDRLAINWWETDAGGTITSGLLGRIIDRPTDCTPTGGNESDLTCMDGLKSVATGTEMLDASSLDLRRVAVLRQDGRVALYDIDSGKLLLTVKPASAREVALRKDYLVVLTKKRAIQVYLSKTGAPVKAWPVAPGAAQLDVHSGIAAYAAGRKVHVLRLADGRDRVLATAPSAVTSVEIEAPGIAYADDNSVTFVPLSKANALLG